MDKMPEIELERLYLRPYTLADANDVQNLAGDWEIAKTTLNVPHPYEDGMAEEWIKTHRKEFEKGNLVTLAITHHEEGYLIGTINIKLNQKFENGELGYWIGKRYWNNGYCTEAAKGMLKYGFEELKLNRIYATYLKRNPASGKVMKKLGMKYEGTLREHVKRWGEFDDLVYYGLLKEEYYSIK